jgi:hypothetical protein
VSLAPAVLEELKCVLLLTKEGKLHGHWSLVLSVLDELNRAFTFYIRQAGLWSLVLSV